MIGEVFVYILLVLFVVNFCRAIYETAKEFDDINRIKRLFQKATILFRQLLGNRSTGSLFA